VNGDGGKPGPSKPSSNTLLSRVLRHPVLWLSGASAVGTLVSLVQFAIALTVLTPVDFAIIGVLLSAGTFVVNFVDMRLIDLTTKLFNDVEKEGQARQLDVLGAGLLIQAGLAAIVIVVAGGVVWAAGTWLLTQPIHWSLIVAAAVMPAATLVSSTLSAYLRLLGAFDVFAAYRLVSQLTQAAIVIALLLAFKSAGAYVVGIGVASVVILVMSWLWVRAVARNKMALTFLAERPSARSLRQHTSQTSFLAAGSSISLAKMISRTGDVLIMAALSDERTTGLYRVARQAVDALFALADSVNQFYGPTIVAAVSGNDLKSYHHLRARVILLACLATAAGLALALLVLPSLGARFAPQHLDAVHPFAVFVLGLLFVIGIHGWLWNALVARGEIGGFGLASVVGAIGQGVAMVVLALLGKLTATTAAACWIVGLAITYLPLLASRAMHRWGGRA
jgi:O-antigen/teichoic acid export membrane protein